VDRPWNQDAARNIGAHEARGRYLLLTDIDHVVPESTLLDLCEIEDHRCVYTLPRAAHFSDKVIPSHVNSYFLSRSLYWDIGGYDEDFWGAYGSDRLFRTRLLKSAPVKELPNSRLELVTRGSIPDAKNTNLSRRPSLWRRLRSLSLRLFKNLGMRKSPVTLTNPYSPDF
jgi:predicted glycosyltransferase involved in capsule biosynthesis